jgi:mannose-6-phosphate isomerase-like protein (cupin superfamily)
MLPERLNLADAAAQLSEPFAMLDLATIGDLTVSLYLCHGVLAWHRHLDQDELFWVHQGAIHLESERGRVRLRPGELAVVRKGLSHRSASAVHSTVILMRCTVVPGRKNGRPRLFGTPECRPRRVRLDAARQRLRAPHRPRTVARVEDTQVQVALCEGTWSIPEGHPHDTLLVVLDGAIEITVASGTVSIRPDQMAVIPRSVPYQLTSQDASGVALVRREG